MTIIEVLFDGGVFDEDGTLFERDFFFSQGSDSPCGNKRTNGLSGGWSISNIPTDSRRIVWFGLP